ncbi:MAG TPA: methyltransferase domain-containing protein [Gammaproteobacteria bacterium]
MPSEVLACPRCGGAVAGAEALRCDRCALDFPRLDGIPCLTADPGSTLGEWRNRLHFLVNGFRREIEDYDRSLNRPGLPRPTVRRMTHVRDALDEHLRRLAELLEPLDIGGFEASYDSQLALKTRLPPDQGLATYYNNVHRDWCWGDEENDLSAEIVARSLRGPHDELLVLGSGASRLAYDLHQSSMARSTIAADFNPMLMLLAKRIARGETIELYEFPIAPRGIEDYAVRRALRAPEPAREGLEFVIADATRPPFRIGSLGAIVVPWLVDILPDDFVQFARRMNRLLRVDGVLIIFGSLSFHDSDMTRRYSLEECLGILEESGFEGVAFEEARIPYMRSPASRHARRELVIALRADKKSEADAPSDYQALPDWLLRDDLPVPLSPSFQSQAVSTRIYAFIMSLIDGKRSPADIAEVLAREGLMTLDEARPAIRGFLLKMHDDSERQTGY